MRGRGENPAPHLFYTRQAPPRLVGQFFWTIVQIFGRWHAGVVRLILKIEAQGGVELVAGGGVLNSATPACFEGGAVESFKNGAFLSSRRGRTSESRFEAWASWAVIKTHRALLQVLDCAEGLALFIKKKKSGRVRLHTTAP